MTQKANMKAFIKNGALEDKLGKSEFEIFPHLNLCFQHNIHAKKNPSVG